MATLQQLVASVKLDGTGKIVSTIANSDALNAILKVMKTSSSNLTAPPAIVAWMRAHGIAASRMQSGSVPAPAPVLRAVATPAAPPLPSPSQLPTLVAQIALNANGSLASTTQNSDRLNTILKVLKTNASSSLSGPPAVLAWLGAHGIPSARLQPVAATTVVSTPTQASLSTLLQQLQLDPSGAILSTISNSDTLNAILKYLKNNPSASAVLPSPQVVTWFVARGIPASQLSTTAATAPAAAPFVDPNALPPASPPSPDPNALPTGLPAAALPLPAAPLPTATSIPAAPLPAAAPGGGGGGGGGGGSDDSSSYSAPAYTPDQTSAPAPAPTREEAPPPTTPAQVQTTADAHASDVPVVPSATTPAVTTATSTAPTTTMTTTTKVAIGAGVIGGGALLYYLLKKK